MASRCGAVETLVRLDDSAIVFFHHIYRCRQNRTYVLIEEDVKRILLKRIVAGSSNQEIANEAPTTSFRVLIPAIDVDACKQEENGYQESLSRQMYAHGKTLLSQLTLWRHWLSANQ